MINEQDKKVAIVGGGIAGMQAANVLGRMGYDISLFEKENHLGGNVSNWSHLFPNNESASEILVELESMLKTHTNIKVFTQTPIESLESQNRTISITTKRGVETFDALIIATGFTPFDASRKEEYGYGVFDNVITSVDFEFADKNGTLRKSIPAETGKVGFVHCVGSRDEKVCNEYCSKACCITAIKQAIATKKINPKLDVYCFYMDLRLFDRKFEKMYREAQEIYGVQFIRGRLSEVNEDISSKLSIRVEDTLSKRPMKLELDLLVLMVGMEPSETTKHLGILLNIQSDEDKFIKEGDKVLVAQNMSLKKGIFIAGTAKGPSTVKETLADAKSIAINVHFFLKNMLQ